MKGLFPRLFWLFVAFFGTCEIAGIILVVLKLAGTVDWTWKLTLVPLCTCAALILLVLIAGVAFGLAARHRK